MEEPLKVLRAKIETMRAAIEWPSSGRPSGSEHRQEGYDNALEVVIDEIDTMLKPGGYPTPDHEKVV